MSSTAELRECTMSWPGEKDMKAAIMSLISKPQASASRINAVLKVASKHYKVRMLHPALQLP